VAGLGREAQDSGVKLSVHNHADNPLMHVEDLSVFFEQAQDVPYGLTVDTAHLIKSGISDIAGVIRRFAASIDNFHMKDIRDGEFAVLGEGTIDFAPVFEAVRDVGYDGWVSADEESGSEAGAALEQCYRVMAEGLGL
jgi:inosose dehydratase